MRSRFVVRFAAIAALVAVTGALKCAEGPLDVGLTPATSSVAGTWQGEIEGQTIRLVLTVTGTDVTGTGTITDNATPVSATVTGTNTDAAFSLTVTPAQFQPFTYVGTVQRNGSVRSMVGIANGSGFTNEQITLVRQ